MADATVQLQPDGTGKLVDNSSLTVGGQTVYRQRINFADPNDALGLARVMASVPSVSEYGVVVRHAGPLPAGTNTLGGVTVVTAGAVPVTGRPDGSLRVLQDPTTILYDGFESFDTTNTWSGRAIGSGSAPSASGSVLTMSGSTTASSGSQVTSLANFTPGTSSFLHFTTLLLLETSPIVNTQRLFGLGTIPASPTSTAPATNGAFFETDTATGGLFGSVYAGGVRTQSVALSYPTDGLYHRYVIFFRASRVYYEIDGVVVGTLNVTTPIAASALPISYLIINGTTAPATAPLLRVNTAAVGDAARQFQRIGDGLFPWRQVTVKAAGAAPTTSDLPMVVALSPIGNTARGTQAATALPTQDLKDSGRTRVSIIFQGASTATADTLLSITKVSAGVAATAASSVSVTSGKILRITSVTFSIKAAAASATAGTMTLRSNPTGATTINSQSELRLDVGTTAAVAGAADKVEAIFPDGMEFSGTQTIGISITSLVTGTINSISLNGFEY